MGYQTRQSKKNFHWQYQVLDHQTEVLNGRIIVWANWANGLTQQSQLRGICTHSFVREVPKLCKNQKALLHHPRMRTGSLDLSVLMSSMASWPRWNRRIFHKASQTFLGLTKSSVRVWSDSLQVACFSLLLPLTQALLALSWHSRPSSGQPVYF